MLNKFIYKNESISAAIFFLTGMATMLFIAEAGYIQKKHNLVTKLSNNYREYRTTTNDMFQIYKTVYGSAYYCVTNLPICDTDKTTQNLNELVKQKNTAQAKLDTLYADFEKLLIEY